jgi:hypothetical protein
MMWDIITWQSLILSFVFLVDLAVLVRLARDEVRDWRAARRGRVAARTDWRRRLLPARDSKVIHPMRRLVIISIGCIGIGVVAWQFAPYGVAYIHRADQNPSAHALSTQTAGGVARTSFTYYARMTRIPQSATPNLKDRSFSITALLEIPQDGATGMIITQGGTGGGWAFYVESGRPVFHYNVAGVERYTIAAERPLAPGQHKLMFAFNFDGRGGTGTISTNGEPIAQGRIERTIQRPVSFDEGLDVGEDTGTPVNFEYDVPFKFTGKIARVTVDLGVPPTLFHD